MGCYIAMSEQLAAVLVTIEEVLGPVYFIPCLWRPTLKQHLAPDVRTPGFQFLCRQWYDFPNQIRQRGSLS